MFDLAFLFGAGASKGSGSVGPYAPPVMNELFDKLAATYPDEWGDSSRLNEYAGQFRCDFEEAFNEYVLKNSANWPPNAVPTLDMLELQRRLALYFSKFRLELPKENLYTRLLEHLRLANILDSSFFATINYECLIERAARFLGLHINYCQDWSEEHVIRIAKLHGSCNFITSVDPYLRAALSGGGVHSSATREILEPTNKLHEALAAKFRDGSSSRSNSYYPIMNQISPAKEEYLFSQDTQNARIEWEEAVKDAKTVVVIGVRYNADDGHIVNPLVVTNGRILYVGDRKSFEKWHTLNEGFIHVGETFAESFDALMSFLKSSAFPV